MSRPVFHIPSPASTSTQRGGSGHSSATLRPSVRSVDHPGPSALKNPSMDYTHFVSLPLASYIYPELAEKLTNFQNSILGNSTSCSDLGIEKSIFINPQTFHLTVLMLKLGNKERVDAASKLLKGMFYKIREELGNKPVEIRLKGLDCLRGTVAEAGVLYAPVKEIGSEGRLAKACHAIIDAFIEAGLADKDAKQRFKLHATVMNVKHRRRKTTTKKFDSFDARDIFKQYGAKNWGEYLIREAHLSQRFAYDENRYFHCCASVPFPKTSKLTESKKN